MIQILVVLYLAELVVGAVQVIGALIRTIFRLSKGLPLGKLKWYWIVVLSYFVILFVFYFAVTMYSDHVLTSTLNSFNDLNSNDEELEKSSELIIYFNMAIIAWVGLAWIIAIWYWVAIVFNSKPKENKDVQL